MRKHTAGDFLCIDESKVKAYHRYLTGKGKIIRKPRPIGNEFKTLCDGRSKIVLYIEMHEGKESMKNKEYVDEFGASTATCLRLTKHWSSSGRVVVGDSWFGSVKSAVQLMRKHGLYSILLVKTAHKLYPKEMLNERKIERGEWNVASAVLDDMKLVAVRFKDLKDKQFISTCSTSTNGEPRQTHSHGVIQRPKVAVEYLKYSSGIDIHNHVRTGPIGFEDAWQTKRPHHRQFAGIMSFLFSNAYLAMKTFSRNDLKHLDFKMCLANQMTQFASIEQGHGLQMKTRSSNSVEMTTIQVDYQQRHVLRKLNSKNIFYQRRCFFCQHGRSVPADVKTR